MDILFKKSKDLDLANNESRLKKRFNSERIKKIKLNKKIADIIKKYNPDLPKHHGWQISKRTRNGIGYYSLKKDLFVIITIESHYGILWRHFAISKKHWKEISYKEIKYVQDLFCYNNKMIQVIYEGNKNSYDKESLHLWSAIGNYDLLDFPRGQRI